jgi:hypothetical protein
MITREIALVIGVTIADVAVIGWLFVRVGKEQIAKEDLATDEMRARTLDYYRNDEGRSALTRRDGQRSRIADTTATTNNTRSLWD